MPGVPYYRLVKILDVNNTEQALSVEDGALCTRSYLQAIAEGDIANHTLWSKIGYALGMTANVNTDVWSYSQTQPVYLFPTVAMGMEIVSSNVGSWFEIDEVCIIKNSNSQFLYNVFGPNGLNKSIADYLMLFKAGGNLVANAWSKTGALLRWDQDGSVTNSNTMPAYTRGSNLGIVMVSSTVSGTCWVYKVDKTL